MQPQEQEHWHDKLGRYLNEEWASKPSIFALFAADYLPSTGKLLELGSGSGQNSVFFATKGYQVTQTDAMDDAFVQTMEKAAEQGTSLTQDIVDLWEPLPYADGSFDVVYAELVLHYFDEQKTHDIFGELRRVLKPGGVLAAMFNSTDDPEYGQGEEIEPDYFQVEKLRKRYFSVDTLRPYLIDFDILLLDNQGETYKDLAKGVRNQLRLIAKKS